MTLLRSSVCKATFVGLVLVTFGASGCRLSANFHEIDEGRLYRSAQLTRSEFKQAIRKVGIKTIMNLRGESKGEDWYDDEYQVATANNVALVNIKMSATRLPHRDDLIKLLDTFRDAERPILVHCRAGADRTGEASAIYQMEYMGRSKTEALDMLTPKYLHVPLFAPAKTYFIKKYQGSDWAYNVYDPCVQKYDYYDQSKYCAGKHATDTGPEWDR